MHTKPSGLPMTNRAKLGTRHVATSSSVTDLPKPLATKRWPPLDARASGLLNLYAVSDMTRTSAPVVASSSVTELPLPFATNKSWLASAQASGQAN